ncbi:MAG: response regulator [Cytophagaceae bacterium]|nr:response regulator [Cytophagaceae bacterium]
MKTLNCVLLVDDDNVNNFLTEKVIQKIGLCRKIKTSLNGEEALLYLAKNCCSFQEGYPELILLDNNMPEMNGIEFMESFNQINFNSNNKVKIVVLTASENPRDKEKLEKLGVEAYLTKPLTEEKLLSIL